MRALPFAALVLALSQTVAGAQRAPGLPNLDSLQAQLDAYRAANALPGAVLAVALDDGRVVSVASGMSDTTLKLAMRTDDRLLMGSVGKTYVAAIALMLARDDRLDLDAAASRYVGGQGWYDSLPNAAAITVRHLMNHTSGLVRYEFRPQFATAWAEDPHRVWDPRDQVRLLHGTDAPFSPGDGWEYSDTNYLVLALIVERITGQPIDERIAARVLRPNQLESTIPSDMPTIPGLAQGYAGPGNRFGGRDAMLDNGRMSFNPQFEGAGGGYAATAADAARWGAIYFRGRPFGDSLLAQALNGPVAPLGPGMRYGLGMILQDSTVAGPMRGHGGSFAGYRTELRHYPIQGVTIALLVNTTNARPTPPMAGWIDALAAAIGGSASGDASRERPSTRRRSPDAAHLPAAIGGAPVPDGSRARF